MAELRCEFTPYTHKGTRPTVTRLASEAIDGCIHTWETSVTVHLKADGSGRIKFERNGKDLGVTVIIHPEENQPKNLSIYHMSEEILEPYLVQRRLKEAPRIFT